MYEGLGEARLATGERLEIGVVTGPDASWGPAIRELLAHKNPFSRRHLELSLAGPLDGLESRYFIGCVDGAAVGQVMVVSSRGVGIVGHVFTLPEHRQKGIARAVMARQMEFCRAAGTRVLCLGTGFDTHPYHLYRSFGFQSIASGSGCMVWESEPGEAARRLAPGPVESVKADWSDWPHLVLLGMRPPGPGDAPPRSVWMKLEGQGCLEGAFSALQFRREREPEIQARVLRTAEGACAGWALLGPPPPGDAGAAPDADSLPAGIPSPITDGYLLDLYAASGFHDALPVLLGSLRWPPCPVYTVTATGDDPRGRALAAAGFNVCDTAPHRLRQLMPAGRVTVRRRP